MRVALMLVLVFRAGVGYGAEAAPQAPRDVSGAPSVAPVTSATAPAGSLRGSIEREAARLAASGVPAASAQQPSADPERSWVRQHPVLTGALVGAASGAVWGYIFCRGACEGQPQFLMLFFGGIGAGAGAGMGGLLSAIGR